MLGNYYGGHMLGWGVGGGLMMILFWIALIVFTVWVVREMSRKDNTHTPQNSEKALNVLKERYARGEISKEQFDSMKNDIISS